MENTETKKNVKNLTPETTLNKTNSETSNIRGLALKLLRDFKNVIFTLLIVIGFLVLFFYSYFEINFFPRELSLGDSLFFIYLALGFGFIVLAFNLMAIFFVWPYYELMSYYFTKEVTTNSQNKKPKKTFLTHLKNYQNPPLKFTTLLIIIIGFASIHIFYFETSVKTLVIMSGIASILTLVANQGFEKNHLVREQQELSQIFLLVWFICPAVYISIFGLIDINKKFWIGLYFFIWLQSCNLSLLFLLFKYKEILEKKLQNFIVLIIFIPIFIVLCFVLPFIITTNLSNKNAGHIIFEAAGIRHEDASLILTAEAENKISSLLNLSHLISNTCKRHNVSPSSLQKDANSQVSILKDVTVLWHSVGRTSYIQIHLPIDTEPMKNENTNGKCILLELNIEEFTLVK